MKQFPDLTRQERIDKIMSLRRSDVALVLENLSEDLNISAILRTAEGFGIGQIHIIHPEGKKPRLSMNTSSGATKWLDIQFFTSIAESLNQLKAAGFTTYGALVNPESDILWAEDFTGKTAIVMGTEVNGLTEDAQKLVDKNIYLPMYGMTESFNVGVAAGMFLYEVVRQKEKQ